MNEFALLIGAHLLFYRVFAQYWVEEVTAFSFGAPHLALVTMSTELYAILWMIVFTFVSINKLVSF